MEFKVLRTSGLIKELFSDVYGIRTDFLYKARSTQNFKY